ncbi:hypothetical protein [Undibacterium sp. WLHG33]|uniref:hypothetical protein n=1 Tax=Undibacterium sp. WLHG33 TaxID=3412482 RepID=UPI003C2D34EA
MTTIKELLVSGSNGTTDKVLIRQNYSLQKSLSGTKKVPTTFTFILSSSGEELNFISEVKFQALSTDVIYEVR